MHVCIRGCYTTVPRGICDMCRGRTCRSISACRSDGKAARSTSCMPLSWMQSERGDAGSQSRDVLGGVCIHWLGTTRALDPPVFLPRRWAQRAGWIWRWHMCILTSKYVHRHDAVSPFILLLYRHRHRCCCCCRAGHQA